MFKGVIFDLDDTLIDTKNIKHLRKINWAECYKQIPFHTKPLINKALLTTLQSKGIVIGIVTNSPRTYAEKVLNYHKIPYDNLVAYHDTVRRKPYSEPMLKCANNLRTLPQECITIGDNINDIISGKGANMYCIGVTWGESNFDELNSVGCDTIFKNTETLEEYLLNLKGD